MENNGFLYSTKKIVLTILLVSIIATVLTHFVDLNLINSDQRYILNEKIYNGIDKSLYGDEYYLEDDILFYYIKSDKISNYPATQEYFEESGGNLENSDEYTYNEDLDIYERTTYEGNREIIERVENPNSFTNSNFEEPVYKTSYLTNDNIFKSEYGRDFKFDPSTMKFKNDFIYAIGHFDGKNVNYSRKYSGENTDLSRYIENKLYEAIEISFENIDRENGIIDLDFAYAINPNSNKLLQLIENSANRTNYILNLFVFSGISIGIFFLLSLITPYEKMKTSKFYEKISKVPSDLLIIIFIMYMTLGIMLVDNIFDFALDSSYYGLLGIIQVAILFLLGITIYYYIYGFKDLLKNGRNSFLIKNSLLKGIFDILIKKPVLSITNNLEGTNKRTIGLMYFGLLAIGFFGSLIFTRSPMFVFVLWVILITAIFWVMKKYYEDILQIEKTSQEIKNGNFNYKIDEEGSKFKTIANNLNSVGANLDLAVENAIKSERMKTELITNVSHDLKTPLTSIINYSELLQNEDKSIEKQREYAKVINEKSHKLKVLIENLFEVSKVTSNNIELHKEELDFSQLLEQVMGEWEDKLNEKNIITHLNIPERPIILELDGNQTYRILENVFSNVYKYTLENTRVYVDLLNEEKVRLVVKNISKYPLNISPNELLERFTRGDESRNTEGSGLGLSIASSLTEIQGGEFNIDIDGDLFKIEILF